MVMAWAKHTRFGIVREIVRFEEDKTARWRRNRQFQDQKFQQILTFYASVTHI
jgi:hypothetical protein